MAETLKTLETRRSCRSYKPELIEDEKLQAIIKAGTYAATGMGKQSPIIIAVTNKELRDKLSVMNAAIMGASMDPFYGAPVVLIVLADKSVATHVYDGSLVLGNMMTAAEGLGIGSCWIGSFNPKEVSEAFDIPDNEHPVAILPLGYPAEGCRPSDRHAAYRTDEEMVQYK